MTTKQLSTSMYEAWMQHTLVQTDESWELFQTARTAYLEATQ